MRQLPPLSALRAFEAAARHGSFKAAAAELAVTPTAISHQIRTLETHLDLALFERRTRQVVLTDAGARLYPVLRDGFDAFAHAIERLTERVARSRVTISATTAFTARWLLPRLARFRQAHPEIDLQLHASDDVVDLARAGVDIAIRYGRGPYPGFVAERLFEDTFAPVASPRLGVRRLADLARVGRIAFDWRHASTSHPTWRRWRAAAGVRALPAGRELRFSEESHAIQAAVAGEGVALVSLALVADEVTAGHLHVPFGPTLPGHAYHVLFELDSREPREEPNVHRGSVVEWLRAEARRNPAERGYKIGTS